MKRLTVSRISITPEGGQLGPKALGMNLFTPASLAADAKASSAPGKKGKREQTTISWPARAFTSASWLSSSSRDTMETPLLLLCSTSGLLMDDGRTIAVKFYQDVSWEQMAWVEELTNLVGEAASALMTDCPTSPVAPMIVTFMMDRGVDFQK